MFVSAIDGSMLPKDHEENQPNEEVFVKMYEQEIQILVTLC